MIFFFDKTMHQKMPLKSILCSQKNRKTFSQTIQRTPMLSSFCFFFMYPVSRLSCPFPCQFSRTEVFFSFYLCLKTMSTYKPNPPFTLMPHGTTHSNLCLSNKKNITLSTPFRSDPNRHQKKAFRLGREIRQPQPF